ncbi:hypothetical protein BDA99DRAFT_518801 [Phascolomyces articulosus]|uniref:ENTH domain-containing protein n=1 Tax=Phascolomyces articulosus TaxID=60185 RepID=A0AAD5JU96_9FUNG|nr:hypothetical protein BDA99DRAFT_518801 [Phascolomyces articulosus]
MNSFSNLQIPDLWEVKDVINKVKNVVLNYTEMEAKVHEATNNEAWGASSTLMQEIAQGTYNYQYFNEIMPTLYKRFTEKEARQWRQIYKALVLLEYLVKNGSERVIDDARAHLSMIKIMRNFHYIDEKGKDQGINIRNRAKEIGELLNDTDKIRAERKKARVNRNKYQGVGSETVSMGGGSGGSSRFGGFGSDSAVGSSSFGFSASTGIGGISASGSAGYYDEDAGGGNNRYESSKYDDFDDLPSAGGSSGGDSSPTPPPKNNFSSSMAKPSKKEVNLFDFDDEPKTSGAAKDDDWGDFASGSAAATTSANDDFDDFQSAPPAAATSSSTAPAKPKTTNDLFDLLGNDVFSSPSSNTPTTSPPPLVQATTTTSMAPAVPSPTTMSRPLSPSSNNNSRPASMQGFAPVTPISANSNNNNNNNTSSTASPAKTQLPTGMWSQASAFVSLDSLGKSSGPAKPAVGPSMNAMKTSSANAGWQAWASNQPGTPSSTTSSAGATAPKQQQSSPFDDLLS